MKAEIAMKTKLINDSAKRSAFFIDSRPNDVQYLFMTSYGIWLVATSADAKGDSSQRKKKGHLKEDDK